ncbi:MAG: hypothetical protein V1913_09995 [Fibrobacterota bacterium]
MTTRKGNMMRIHFIPLFFLWAEAFSAFTLGPMVHVNFGNGKVRLSGGIEYACWFMPGEIVKELPVGFDLGLEFERDRVRLYSEAQAGVFVSGVSLGPVLEFYDYGGPCVLGFQGSVWGACFGGVNIRFRRVEYPVFSPGLFLKYIGGEIPIGC